MRESPLSKPAPPSNWQVGEECSDTRSKMGAHQHTSDFSSSTGGLLLQFSIEMENIFPKLQWNCKKWRETLGCTLKFLQVHAHFGCVHGHLNCKRQIHFFLNKRGVGEENKFNQFLKAVKEHSTLNDNKHTLQVQGRITWAVLCLLRLWAGLIKGRLICQETAAHQLYEITQTAASLLCVGPGSWQFMSYASLAAAIHKAHFPKTGKSLPQTQTQDAASASFLRRVLSHDRPNLNHALGEGTACATFRLL